MASVMAAAAWAETPSPTGRGTSATLVAPEAVHSSAAARERAGAIMGPS
jgi:hypothetical protein